MFDNIKSSLSSLIKKLRSKKVAKKFLGVIVIFLLTILIPLTIAFCYFFLLDDSQKSISTDISVSLFDINGDLVESDTIEEESIEGSRLVNILYNLSYKKTKITKPTEFTKKPNMSFTVTHNSVTSTFKCYFEEDIKSSYIEDQNGFFYTPHNDTYSAFLSSDYSEPIYKEAIPPALSTEIGDIILPKQVSWSYTLNNDSEKTSSSFENTADMMSYRITGAIDFKFSRSPNACLITVKNLSGETVFSGAPEELLSLTAEENSELLVYITAKWEKNNGFTSYGEQQYEFKIICTEPSEFNISTREACGGQVILLSVTNVTSTESIIYTPSAVPSGSDASARAIYELYAYKPIFVKKGSMAYALLPIPASIPKSEFSFSLSCGISKADFTLKLNEASPNQLTIPLDSEEKEITLTDAQKSDFFKIQSALNYSRSDILLLNGEFALPTDYGFTSKYSYNSRVNDSFTLLAASFSAQDTDGASIKSANTGIVLSTGYSELLGNYVIVDHGMGLCTWYCSLSDVTVSEKDILKKGDVIGRAGSHSMLCDNGVTLFCSVGSTLINPSELIAKK